MGVLNDTDKKKISKEELIKSISESGGNFGIQQVVTDADGNRHVTDIYGNYTGDNEEIKQTINVFLDYSTVPKLAVAELSALSEGIEPIKDAKFRLSVDVIDEAPLTIVCTNDSKGISVCAYIRDDKRTNSVIHESKEWKKGTNLEVTYEVLKEDTCLWYMLMSQHVWRLLIETGKKEVLEKIGNRGTGILITCTQTKEKPEFNIRIVQGKNRPDLLCDLFLIGQEMYRPYLDEIIVEPLLDQMTFEQKLKMAEGGDPLAMDIVAMSYLNGDDTSQDFSKAFYWYRKLAEMENATAQYNLALFYAKGCGVPRNFDKAAEWMLKAADNGEAVAINEADKYRKLSIDIEKADKDDTKAQAELAEFYMGLGSSLIQYGNAENDYKKALSLAEKAEKASEPAALWVLGLAYDHGRGVNKNKNKAIEYYERGADMAHPGCQHNLGCMYLRGDTIKIDVKRGFELCMKAAEQGFVPAMKDVGNCFQFGTGVNADMSSAIFWYEKYLEKTYDPDLEAKVAIFKTLPDKEHASSEIEKGNLYSSHWKNRGTSLDSDAKEKRLAERRKEIKAEIIRVLANSEYPLTLDDLKERVEYFNGTSVTVNEISVALAEIDSDGELIKTYENKRAYYSFWSHEEQEILAEKERHDRSIDDKKALQLCKQQAAIQKISNMICVRDDVIVIVTPEGNVLTSGLPDRIKTKVEAWDNMKQVCLTYKPNFDTVYVVGLTKEGTIKLVGNNPANVGIITNWTDIKYIECGYRNVLAVKNDGSVLSAGHNNYGQLNTGSWRKVKKVLGTASVAIALTTEGIAVECGLADDYFNHTVELAKNNVADVELGGDRSVDCLYTLTKDGRILSPYGNEDEIREWKDIVSISNGVDKWSNIIGVNAEGKIKACVKKKNGNVHSEVLNWNNIAFAKCGGDTIVGVTKDGFVKVSSPKSISDSISSVKLFDNYLNVDEELEQKRKEAEERRIESIKNQIEALNVQIENTKGLFAESKKKKFREQIELLKKQLTKTQQ